MHIECADDDAFRADQAGNLEVDMPVQPGPEFLTVSNGRLRVLQSSQYTEDTGEPTK